VVHSIDTTNMEISTSACRGTLLTDNITTVISSPPRGTPLEKPNVIGIGARPTLQRISVSS
jgi:hypothetical protein